MLSSLPSMNTSKIHLPVEQFSLKANRRLAERLFYNQGCRERFTCKWVGREVIQLGHAPIGEDTEEKGNIMA